MKNLKVIHYFVLSILAFNAQNSHAGYFELSGNGSYYKQNNGKTLGEQNNTTVQRIGGGIGYNFFGNASLEFKYTSSKNIDKYTQVTDSAIYRIKRTSQFKNYGVNIVLDFADRKAPFRPFVTGGLGYMIRKSETAGTVEDIVLLNGQNTLSFTPEAEVKSISADAGIGFKLFMADRLAFEGTFNVFATDLDQSEVFLHYSAAAGLKFLF